MRAVGKGYGLIPLAILVLGMTGCDRVFRAIGLRTDEAIVEKSDSPRSGERIGTQSLSTEGQNPVLLNAEAGIELTLPSTWSEDLSLHPSAELQASDPEQQLFIIVVAEDDASLRRLGLKENAEQYRNILISQLYSFEGQSPTDVAFIGPNFANQAEIRGRINADIPVVYLHTTVVSETRYYQIVAWTTPEQYNFYGSELKEIIETFREIDS